MKRITKLSEATLKEYLDILFADYATKIVSQKRLKSIKQTFIPDYYLETDKHKFAFEFDGPSHYTKSKTQLRDINFATYCKDNNIILVRFPYYLQLDEVTIYHFFGSDLVDQYDLESRIEFVSTEYSSGFHDKNIVYPGDFNSFGWDKFWSEYSHFAKIDSMSVMRQIYDSLEEVDCYLSLGVDWVDCKSKVDFYENYPT